MCLPYPLNVIWGGIVFAADFVISWANQNILVPIVNWANTPVPASTNWQVFIPLLMMTFIGMFYGWVLFSGRRANQQITQSCEATPVSPAGSVCPHCGYGVPKCSDCGEACFGCEAGHEATCAENSKVE